MEVLKVWFDKEQIYLETKENGKASMPLAWFPRLANATVQQREDYELSPYTLGRIRRRFEL